jgi:hypothetical protein
MLLLELLDDPYTWTEETRMGELEDGQRGVIAYQAKFDAGDRQIVVDIDRVPRKGSHWEMAFGERSAHSTGMTLKVTGSGDEFRVFATVIEITRLFMNQHDVDSMSFTAEKSEGSRAQLYQRLVNRLVRGKWKQEIDHKSSDYRSYFTITKKD